MSSSVETETYLFGAKPDIPVITLNADPSDLFDTNSGIYALGPSASANFPYFGAIWQDWEKPAQFEIIDTNGQNYKANAGMKIFGGWSRATLKNHSLYLLEKIR